MKRKPAHVHVLIKDGQLVAMAALYHRKKRNTLMLACFPENEDLEMLPPQYFPWVQDIVDDYLNRPLPFYTMDLSTGDEFPIGDYLD